MCLPAEILTVDFTHVRDEEWIGAFRCFQSYFYVTLHCVIDKSSANLRSIGTTILPFRLVLSGDRRRRDIVNSTQPRENHREEAGSMTKLFGISLGNRMMVRIRPTRMNVYDIPVLRQILSHVEVIMILSYREVCLGLF